MYGSPQQYTLSCRCNIRQFSPSPRKMKNNTQKKTTDTQGEGHTYIRDAAEKDHHSRYFGPASYFLFLFTSLFASGGKLSIGYGNTVWSAAMTEPLISCSFGSTLACTKERDGSMPSTTR